MRVVVQHRSRYHYPRPALLGPQLIRLRPADHTRARIESYQLLVEPEHRLHWLRDPHGNRVARVTFKAGQAVSEPDVLVELAVEINAINPFDFFIDDRARTASAWEENAAVHTPVIPASMSGDSGSAGAG